MSYHDLPLIEYARGACECVLARGQASHVILHSKRQYAHGGLYLAFSEVPFDEPNPEEFIKKELEKPATAQVARADIGWGGRTDRGQVIKVINLMEEDIEEALEDIDEVYKKVTGHEFTVSGGVGY